MAGIKEITDQANGATIEVKKDDKGWRIIIWEGENSHKQQVDRWPGPNKYHTGDITPVQVGQIEAWLQSYGISDGPITSCFEAIGKLRR